jgi:hypothetical protein
MTENLIITFVSLPSKESATRGIRASLLAALQHKNTYL